MAEGAIPCRPVPGKFIVKLAVEARPTILRQSLSAGEQLRPISQLRLRAELIGTESWNQWYTFYSSRKDITADEVISILGRENILHIEQDCYLEFFEFPSDSLFSHQWYLHNTGQSYLGIERIEGDFNDSLILKRGTPGSDIGLNRFYFDPPAEATRVVVAIIDSGTDLLHPELQGRLWRNRDEIPANGVDDDHNGFVDDTLGYDISGDTLAFINPDGDNNPTDEIGHGTHIAGIVASNADGIGIVGIAPTAEIMSVKIRPNATNAIGAAGIIYAVNAGADIISLSWGTPFESSVLKEALDIARRNGVFVCIAAGNSGTNECYYPAAFDSAFSVAAGNSDGFMTSFSTWGPHIDLVAPGLDILSLRAAGTDMYAAIGEPSVRIVDSSGLYYLSDGTSMAAPMVAGAAARLLAVRPDLSLDELETILRLGADDLLDPWNQGDSLPGPDSISGFGYLNVEASLDLLTSGGIHIVVPVRQTRYVDEVDVRIAALSGYTGGWVLDCSLNPDRDGWQRLNSGATLPANSVAYTFYATDPCGHVYLRLTDDFGSSSFTDFIFVNRNRLEITFPLPGDEFNYTIPVIGYAYGVDIDSVTVSYESAGHTPVCLHVSTAEYFDSLIYSWNASGLEAGEYTICLKGFFAGGLATDEVHIKINSAFTEGWPQELTGRGGLSPVCADLDKDGVKEIIVGTTFGLNVFHADGHMADGFPVLSKYNMRSVPAVYDIDRDGQSEIICTNELGVFAFNHDGTLARGWPRLWANDHIGFGYPNPVVTQLGVGVHEDSAVICVTSDGTILAYEFNGNSYFFSLGGWFASFMPYTTTSGFWGGNAVSSTDLTGDGQNEVVVTFSATQPFAGVGIFEGRTGQPAFDRPEPYVIINNGVYGTVLADLNNDNLPEIITVGIDSGNTRTIWVKTRGVDDLPGWPIALPGVEGWRASYPIAADLDLDGIPEILCTFFEFDISSLYIFRADGSPYVTLEGRPVGEAYTQPVTFGTPIVANLTGDDYPEIVIRSGYIMPGTGYEKVHILDYTVTPLPGWPMNTPARPSEVFSTIFAPLVDDIDNDGLVELILVSEANEIYIWDFDASYDNGRNMGRLFMDNSNTSIYGDRKIPTDVPEIDPTLPIAFRLEQNYPNPFNPTTRIEFSTSTTTRVKLEVFNVLGRHVSTLVDDELRPGNHSATFDGSAYASGAYFYRLKAGERRITKKMVLLK